jgi:hypothetical protein
VTVSALAKDLENETLDGNGDGIEDGSPNDDVKWGFTTQSTPPQIASVLPQPDAVHIFTDSKVIINFTKSMSNSDTLDAITYMVDSIEFSLGTSGQAFWTNGDKTLTFTPSSKFQHDKVYTFTINHSAKDANNINLDGDEDGVAGEGGEDDYIWSFRTIPEPPFVQSHTPKKDVTRVEIDSKILITFSKDMDRPSVEDAFSMTHADTNTTWTSLDANITWTSDSKVEFEMDFELEYEKVYTVQIAATAMDLQGITLDGNKNKKPEDVNTDSVSWSFTSLPEPPQIVTTEPTKGEKDVVVNVEIEIIFDKGMDKDDTEDAFTYTYEGADEDFDANSGTVTWTNGDKTFRFQPDLELEEGKTYTVTVDDTATDKDGNIFNGYSWPFTTKINEEPDLAGGGVHPETGDASKIFTFSVIYSDADGDEPDKVFVYIDGFEWRMEESDPAEDDFVAGKAYEFSLDLDEGEYKYYFEVENKKHTVRFPQGELEKTLTVTAVEAELVFGMFEEEYGGLPTMVCLPLGIIILVFILVTVVMLSRKKKAQKLAAAKRSFQAEPPPVSFAPEDSGEFMSFEPQDDELMSFQAFEEEPPPTDAKPVVIECPECGEHLRIRAAHRPFTFPCKCGAKLVLK